MELTPTSPPLSVLLLEQGLLTPEQLAQSLPALCDGEPLERALRALGFPSALVPTRVAPRPLPSELLLAAPTPTPPCTWIDDFDLLPIDESAFEKNRP